MEFYIVSLGFAKIISLLKSLSISVKQYIKLCSELTKMISDHRIHVTEIVTYTRAPFIFLIYTCNVKSDTKKCAT